jgi:hypothetical protein
LTERLVQVKTPLVLWHRPCPDGSCAAWLARRRWPDAELVGVQVGDPVEVRDGALVLRVEQRETVAFPLAGRDVLMLDWTPPNPADVLPLVAASARSLMVLDHHDSAIRDLKDADACALGCHAEGRIGAMLVLDKNRSGAGLALDAFFPGSRDRERDLTDPASYGPEDAEASWVCGLPYANMWATILVLSIEDRDLWRFELPGTREDAAFLEWAGVAGDPTKFDGLPAAAERKAQGAAMLRYRDALVNRIQAQATLCRWVEGELLVVNSPVLQSEIGEALYRRAPKPLRAAAVWYENAEGTMVSLRSAADGADCAAIAKARGGGGHVRSAGFKVSHRGPWRWNARLGVPV